MRHTDRSLENYYAARAREYERVYAKPERQPDLRQLENLLPAYFANCRVLDVACGTGYWTQFLASTARNVVAVDISPETMGVAAQKSWPSGRVSFHVADAYALPDDLGSFDAVFAGFWWSHVPVRDRRRFLVSLDRRLSVRAKVLFLDNLFIEGSNTPIADRDTEGNTYQRRCLEDGSEYLVLKNFPSEAELCADVAAFGCNVQFTGLRYYWLFSYEKHGAA